MQTITSELWHQAVIEGEQRDTGAPVAEIEAGKKASILRLVKIAITALRHTPYPAPTPTERYIVS